MKTQKMRYGDILCVNCCFKTCTLVLQCLFWCWLVSSMHIRSIHLCDMLLSATMCTLFCILNVSCDMSPDTVQTWLFNTRRFDLYMAEFASPGCIWLMRTELYTKVQCKSSIYTYKIKSYSGPYVQLENRTRISDCKRLTEKRRNKVTACMSLNNFVRPLFEFSCLESDLYKT